MPTTRLQAQNAEDARRQVKNEALHERQREAQRRDPNSWPLVTIDSDDKRDQAEGPQPPKRARTNSLQREEGGEEGSSSLQRPAGEESPAEAPPVVVKQELAEVKQEADLPPRRKKKKKRVDRVSMSFLAAATTQMAEMERQIESLKKTVEQGKAEMAEQKREISSLKTEVADLKQKLVVADTSTGDMEESTTTISVPPTDQATNEKKKPKLKDDARRAVMQHAFGIDHNEREQLTTNGAHDQLCGDVLFRHTRRRTLRFFFCCRSFSAVFFRLSKRFADSAEQPPIVELRDEEWSLWITSGGFGFYLTSARLSRRSLFLLLQLGQAEVRRLILEISTIAMGFSTLNDTSSWPQVLPALRNLRELKAVHVEIDSRYFGERQSSEIIDALRGNLPDPITSFTSLHLEDFRLLAPEVRRVPARKAHYFGFNHEDSSSFRFLLRSNALVIDVSKGDYLKEFAEHGPFEPNAAVERVEFQADIISTEDGWKKEVAPKFRSSFANLRPLNHRFVLHRWLDGFEVQLHAMVTRGLQLFHDAERAGIPTLELDTAVHLPNPITNYGEYQPVWLSAREVFAKHPEFELQTEGLDEDSADKYETFGWTTFCVWKTVFFGHKLSFFFLYYTRD
ncbi:hypothetical protein M3Y99_00243900 [Aphelenchoides fujianensis]|nr:hypothetical protein M3Y99_00243900 [Aphelenchoides fujianensis]